MTRIRRRGSSLVLVLSTITLIGAVTVAGRATSAVSVTAIQNRQEVIKAEFAAEGCLAELVFTLDSHLASAQSPYIEDTRWAGVPDGARSASCRVTTHAAGELVDVNDSPIDMVTAALRLVADGREDEKVARLVAWRSQDEAHVASIESSRGAAPNATRLERRFESYQELLTALGHDEVAYRSLSVLGVENAPLWRDGRVGRLLAASEPPFVGSEPVPLAWLLRAGVPTFSGSRCLIVEWRIARVGNRIAVLARQTIATGERGIHPVGAESC